MFFNEVLQGIYLDFINPAERFFLPVLLFNFTLALLFLVLWKGEKGWLTFKSLFFNKKIWWHDSAKLDYQLFIINNIFRILFLLMATPFLINSAQLSIKFLQVLRGILGESPSLSDNWWIQKMTYTLLAFVIMDFFRFFQHYLFHKIKFLWRFHRLHHSAEVLTPFTLNRVHPVELLAGMGRTAISIALSSALYVWLFQAPLQGMEILGVNLLGFLFNCAASNLRHSHFPFSFGVLEHIFISPSQHQIHHSNDPIHYNKNYGICLSVWDKLFGSWERSDINKKIDFGIKGFTQRSLFQAFFK